MLTTKRCILITFPNVINQYHYEALVEISNIQQVQEVWRNNKTPILSTDSPDLHKIQTNYPNSTINIGWLPPENFIPFANSHGFEPGEFITGEKHDTSKEYCFLCDIANGIEKNGLEEYDQNIEMQHHMVVYESPNFFVKVELGCLHPSLMMINPKQHILSMALLPSDQLEEYYTIMLDMQNILHAIYGYNKPIIFFEHGSAPDGFSTHTRAIVHAHNHLIWCTPFEQKYKDMVSLKPCSLYELYGKKYLSYQENTNGILYATYDPKVYVQRQYPRQVIAEKLGYPNELSNWRNEPFLDNINQGLHNIWHYLYQNKHELPDRIVERTAGFIRAFPRRKDFYF